MAEYGSDGAFPAYSEEGQDVSDGAFPAGGGKGAPRVVSAVALTSTTIRVVFDSEMNQSDVEDHTNYSFTGSVALTPTNAVRTQADPTLVTVTVNEMTDSASYQVEVDSAVEGSDGTVIDPNNRTASFSGIGVQPQVSSAVALDSTTVRITFNEAMKNDAALTNTANYAIAGPTSPSNVSVNRVSPTIVDLTLTELLQGGSYTVTVSNVVDVAENPIDPAHDDASFTGIGVAPTVDPSATIVDSLSVYVDFSETVNPTGATNPANYAVVPSLGTVGVTQISGTRYKLTFSNYQSPGDPYTITVTNVYDLVGNLVDPANDEATFLGYLPGPPLLYFYPADDERDVAPREFLRVRAVDKVPDSSGIDLSSWNIDVSYTTADGNAVTVRVLDSGVANTLFETVFVGDADDAVDGVTFKFRPIAGYWDPDTWVTVFSDVADNDGYPASGQWIVEFGDFLCFENDPPAISTLDQRLISGFRTSLPATDQLRKIIMGACSQSPSQQVRARTLLWYAVQTELRPLLGAVTDVTKAENIRLCNRSNLIDIYNTVLQSPAAVSGARQEILAIVGDRSLKPVLEYLVSDSPLHVVSAAATLVVYGAGAV